MTITRKLLSASIMAHESRIDFLPSIKEKLGDVYVSMDFGRKGMECNIGVWNNCKRAWQNHDPEADYHVVIQDDAIVCGAFYKQALTAIQLAESFSGMMPALSFYYGNRKNKLKAAEEALKTTGFVIGDRPTWGVAICLPVKLIAEMIEYCDRINIPEDDTRIGRFLKHKKIPVYFPIPSLVDHRTGHGSLVDDPGDYRRAAFFIGRQS